MSEKLMNNKIMNETRAGYLAILGETNSGKSTLINSLTGAKISPVNRKVQTTRRVIRGVLMADDTQIILVDTPGLFNPKRSLDKSMINVVWNSAYDADAALILVDANKGKTDVLLKAIDKLKDKWPTSRPIALVINKIDKVSKEKLLTVVNDLSELMNFDKVFMISALKSDGVGEITTWAKSKMPKGAFLYDPENITDLPLRDYVAEVVREKILDQVHQEIPYQLAVVPEAWENFKNGAIKANMNIILQSQRHKEIILGKNGEKIKAISMAARREIEEQLETKVHLFLFVKVDKNWMNKQEILNQIGLGG